MLKKFLIIIFGMVTAVGSVPLRSLPIFHKTSTTVKQSLSSNIKEKSTKKNVQSIHHNDLNALSDDTENVNSQNSNDVSNEQKNIRSKIENSTNSVINKQTDTGSQLPKDNHTVNTAYENNVNATLKVETPIFHYDRTTSIYANDNTTLLRVEYYINNKLAYYSVIEQFDAVTKSYIEKIYQCNRETNNDPLVRTDVYINGTLIQSY